MKHMKKVCGLLLALAMALSLTVTAFADDPETGSITINGVGTGTTYEIYKLLDLESFDKDSGAYSYKVTDAKWAEFFATTEAKAYMEIDAAGYATWVAGEDDATVAAFAQLALAYAKKPNPNDHVNDPPEQLILPVQSSENDGEFVITGTTGVFSDLPLGYYLVDSTMGALCGLTTTDPDASINAKNHVPIVDKQVEEDLTGMYGDVNTADIGQIVNFMTIIHVAAGAENYVLHDKMSDGLTFEQNLDDPNNLRGVTEIKHYTSGSADPTTLTPGADYTVKTDPADDCTFEVEFTEAGMKKLKTNDRLVVYYNAMLNRNAVIAGTGNENESWLEYGEDHFTTHDKTQTYTFSIDIVKTDSSNKLIDGAQFRIYDAATDGSEVKVVLMDDGVTYRRARSDEAGVDIIVKGGKVTVVGFDNGVYYLEETVAPTGYNKLTARKEFTIADANLDSVFNGEIYSTGSGVHVTNKTGTMLPETGGMGTVLFVTFGTIVVLGAGVLLVTKKRMSMIR